MQNDYCKLLSSNEGVLRNFAKLTGKHLCQILFFNKVVKKVFKKETLAQVFSCEFCQISKNTFSTEHLRATASKIRARENQGCLWLFTKSTSWRGCYVSKSRFDVQFVKSTTRNISQKLLDECNYKLEAITLYPYFICECIE